MKYINRDAVSDSFIRETQSLRVQAENSSQFGEFLIAGRTPIIELNSSYGTSQLRDIKITDGSGSIDDINGSITTGEILLSTGATASSSALLESAEIARYIPGYSAEIGLGVRLPDVPTGDQAARFGGRTLAGDDGFYFIYDSDGLGVVVQRGGTETVRRQADWNLDPVNGDGPSGYDIDLMAGIIFQIDYTWYGYGAVRFSIISTGNGALQRPIPVHVFTIADFNSTSITDPNLQVFAEAINGTTASDFQVYVGGRQYSIVGNYVPKFRYTGALRGVTSVGTTPVPLVSFQYKPSFRNRSVKLDGFGAENAANQRAFIEVRIDCTLTGASYGTPGFYTAGETALEADIAATALTGGDVIYPPKIVPSAREARFDFSNLDLDLPALSTIHLVGYTLSGTTDLVTSFDLREEW